jgi:hypothetical protein
MSKPPQKLNPFRVILIMGFAAAAGNVSRGPTVIVANVLLISALALLFVGGQQFLRRRQSQSTVWNWAAANFAYLWISLVAVLVGIAIVLIAHRSSVRHAIVVTSPIAIIVGVWVVVEWSVGRRRTS